MPIKIMKRYSPEICRQNPSYIFVFGDNLGMDNKGFRYGRGGQACIRDEPNALGIATKASPNNSPEAFFSDTPLLINLAKAEFEKKFAKLGKHLANGGTIVWPEDGIGTGLAELPTRAPQIWAMLDKYREKLFAYGTEN